MYFNLYSVFQSTQNSTDIQTTLINYALSVVSVVFYSSSNIPIKSHECGDGVYFVWLTSISMFISGFILNSIRNYPSFHYEPVIGGVLLCIGQILNVAIIRLFGLGVPTLVYSIIVVMVGWIMSVVGFLGMQKAVFYEAYLNYIGLAFCLISIVAFSFIKLNVKQDLTDQNTGNDINGIVVSKPDNSFLRAVGLKLIAFLLAIAIGLCFGTQFLPTYILLGRSENDPSLSSDPLDYIFPQTVGMLVGGTTILFLYCLFKMNRPFVNPKLVLPGFLSGALLGAGTVFWGYSSYKLSPAVSYPLVSVGSPALSTLYGICFFREIKGKRNYIILASGLIPMTIGVILVGLSRIQI
ncbi:putative membrane protein [Oopsacas minuta]|uniref:Membrane protein n=1 Tax=Oopsacas minuta TaxID=111878 RepID=A0AAV7K2J1_9METZ|nr:putative membrane protein [Oopsacas minuta]